jgi:protein ImuA
LRRKVRALEEGGARWPAVSLGDAQLDARLPQRGLVRGALHEAVPAAYLDGPAAFGFALAAAGRFLAAAPGALVVIVQPGAWDFGAAYGPGLRALGVDPARLLLVRPPDPQAALIAYEEAARTAGVNVALGVFREALGMIQSRRLQLAAEASGVAAWAVVPREAPASVAARTRWAIAAAPSDPPAWAQAAGLKGRAAPPGAPRWRAQLVRARGGARHGDGEAGAFFLELEQRDAAYAFRASAPVADAAPTPARAAQG